MRIFTVLIFVLGVVTLAPFSRTVSSAPKECGSSAKAHVRTTLYFGLSRPSGTVGDSEWSAFLREEVTSRFPDGLTVWEADGQWRRSDTSIAHERAKVLLLVHDGSSKAQKSISDVVSRYKRQFQQESVLWESATVCAAF